VIRSRGVYARIYEIECFRKGETTICPFAAVMEKSYETTPL